MLLGTSRNRLFTLSGCYCILTVCSCHHSLTWSFDYMALSSFTHSEVKSSCSRWKCVCITCYHIRSLHGWFLIALRNVLFPRLLLFFLFEYLNSRYPLFHHDASGALLFACERKGLRFLITSGNWALNFNASVYTLVIILWKLCDLVICAIVGRVYIEHVWESFCHCINWVLLLSKGVLSAVHSRASTISICTTIAWVGNQHALPLILESIFINDWLIFHLVHFLLQVYSHKISCSFIFVFLDIEHK